MGALLIGSVAKRAGVSPPTIRYYEEIGLLAAPTRSLTGYRRYPERTVDELRFIEEAQALGLSLDEVAEILKLSRSGQAPCAHVLSPAHQRPAALEERIRQLQQFHDHLEAELTKWVSGGPRALSPPNGRGVRQPTCDGLCEIITTAEPDLTTGPIEPKVGSTSGKRVRKL